MSAKNATLYLLCGKIAAGKSTLATQLGQEPHTVVVCEDHWLARLYADEMVSVTDYVRCSARLREAMEPHLINLLRVGTSVVLDFPANTLAHRAWMRGIFEKADAAHKLHYLDMSDEVCKARLRARNSAGSHEFAASEAEFDLITSHFVAPTPDEGFDIIVHRS